MDALDAWYGCLVWMPGTGLLSGCLVQGYSLASSSWYRVTWVREPLTARSIGLLVKTLVCEDSGVKTLVQGYISDISAALIPRN